MTKPNWCPEDIWLDTGMAFDQLYDAEPDLEGGCEQGVRVMAARAAMNERERCVKACEHEIDLARSFGPHHIPIISSVLKAIRAS